MRNSTSSRRLLQTLLLIFLVFTFTDSVTAQSPGDVTSNLKLWLKADAGVTGTGPVTSWANQTGTTTDAIQVGDAPDLLTDQVNFNPVIDFNGNNDYLQINGGILGTNTYNDIWVYSVTKADGINNSTLLRESAGNGRLAVLNPWGGSSYIFTGGGIHSTSAGANTVDYNIWTHGSSTGTATPSGTRKRISRDGAFLGSGSSNNSFVTGNGSDLLIGAGWDNGLGTSNNLNAKVAEMIVYTSVPSPLEQERIQSYLAIKYGITKTSADNVTTSENESNYFASDATVIWDALSNVDYQNAIAGIGRDDNTSLDQQQSRSINQGSVVTMAKGGAFDTDKNFIVWGNNGLTGTSSPGVLGYDLQSNQVWKTAVTGTPGAVSLSIDVSSFGFDLLNSAASALALLIDADGDFTSGAVENEGVTLSNGILTFTGISFNDGDFFTIAGPKSIGPGDVTSNLKLWLKADAGVTGTGPVTSWANQTGTTTDAIQVGDAPDLLTDQVNFNPVIDFNGNNDYLQIDGGILGTNTYNDIWVYSVTKADGINNSTLLRESAGNGRLAVLNPWGGSSYIFTGGGIHSTSAGANTVDYNIWTHGSSTGTATPSGTRKRISRDGAFLGSGSSNNSFVTGNGSDLLIGAGWDNGLGTSNNLNAKVAEMIVYTSVPSPLEQERIQSYLAIKYGITKTSADNVTTSENESNYFASDATVIWDALSNVDYQNAIAGIGRDDNTGLDQQQSRSINQGSVVTMAKGGAFDTDKNFIVWGNNGLTGTDEDVPGYDILSNQVWKTAVTGTPGAVSLSIDVSSFGFDLLNITASDLALVIDADGDFTSGAVVNTTGSLSSGILTFTGVSFSNGDFFTIAQGPRVVLVYSGGVWSPSAPNGASAENDALIVDGTYNVDNGDIVNKVLVQPEGSIVIDASEIFTLSRLILESTSVRYSSLILDGTLTDGSSESIVTYKRHVNQNASVGGNDLVTPPVTGEGFDTFRAANSNILSNGDDTLFLFGPFDKSIGAYVTYSNTETVALTSGVGYRAGTTDNSTLSFKGVANKGDINDITISNSGPAYQEWNLVGNPYPSYLNVQDFLIVNNITNSGPLEATNVGIYGYDGDASDGWVIYNLNTTTPSTLIAPGQGFFVATDAGGSLSFTTGMRRIGTSDDFILGRNSTFINTHLKLQLSTTVEVYNTDFYFNENSTLALDPGYDAGVWGNNAPSFSIYSELVDESTGLDLAIQSLPLDNLETMIIPLGIHSSSGEQITVSIAESDLPASTEVYLEDRVNNTFTLLTTSDFVYTPTEALNDTGRFYLRFSTESLATTENELEDLRIFTTKTPRVLTVSGQLLRDTELKLYDVRGRLVLTKRLNEAAVNNQIDISRLEDGIYVVELNNLYQRKTQKVIIR
jgi:hypothetical protein